MVKQSKRMKALRENGLGKRTVALEEAVGALKGFGNTKFDQSVEIAMRLGIDPKQADQIVRGSIVLPHGIGRTLRVIVFAKGEKINEAQEAGADEVGGKELAEKILRMRGGIKVLHASGYPDDAIAHHGVLKPGIALLEKPFTPETLGCKVRQVLG